MTSNGLPYSLSVQRPLRVTRLPSASVHRRAEAWGVPTLWPSSWVKVAIEAPLIHVRLPGCWPSPRYGQAGVAGNRNT